MGLFGKSKDERAVEALRSQLGIDLYESGSYDNEKHKEYCVSIVSGYDFIAVINRKNNGRFIAKEWYLYDRSKGWVKKGALNRQQSIQLYCDTQPYYTQDVLKDHGGRLPPEREESWCLALCDEYFSNYMTSQYLGFSVKGWRDSEYKAGKEETYAIYMPHRSPPPKPLTSSQLDKLADEMMAVFFNSK